MKKIGLTLVLCFAVLDVLGCNNNEPQAIPGPQGIQSDDQKMEQAIGKLADSHNAVVHWRKGLINKDPFARTYTSELTQVLVRPDGRPILFIADVLDVSSAGKDDLCSFEADVNASQKVRLILDCEPDVATRIMKSREGKYAVVAHITSVESVIASSNDDPNQQTAWFRGHGECLGEVSLGPYYLDDMFELYSFPPKNPEH